MAINILDLAYKIKLDNLNNDKKIVLFLLYLDRPAHTGEISTALQIHQVRVNEVLTILEKYHFVEKSAEKYPPVWIVTPQGREWGGRNGQKNPSGCPK